MPYSDTKTFRQHWNKFITKLKGRILKESKVQPLTYENYKEILEDVKLCWSSSFEANGRWLKGFVDTDPIKGKRISDILLEDMSFEEEKEKSSPLRFLIFLLPLLIGGSGFLIAKLLKTKLLIQIISGGVPALLMILSCIVILRGIKATSRRKLIDNYLEQLCKYSNSIESIIES